MGGKHNQSKILNCLQCSKEVKVPNYRIPIFKYCSRVCLGLAHRQKIKTNCKICGNEFQHISSRCNKAKYCSTTCYKKSQKKVLSEIISCQHCDKPFNVSPDVKYKRKYCGIACTNKAHHSEWKPTYAVIRRTMERRGLIQKCELCGYDEVKEILGIHHRDHNHSNNEFSNLAVMCANCHSLQHHKHIVHGGYK